MTRRAPGTGTVERWRGRHRARLPDAERTVLGVCDTREQAERLLDAHFAVSTAPVGHTLATYGPRWLDRREREGHAGIDRDRSRWTTYVAPWECAAWPLREIRRGDVRRWLEELSSRGLADQTRRNALAVVRGCLGAAVDDELLERNPAEGLRVKRRGTTERTWDWLRLDELDAMLGAMPKHLRALAAFAAGTGLRWGELRVLRRADVVVDGDSPHVRVVRAAGRTAATEKAPKSTQHRTVPLFGLGLDAARALLAVEHTQRNERGLVALTPRGEPYRGANGPRLDVWLAAAHVDRHARWHDLRHTCASLLISGAWGRVWSLVEVRDLLGHSSVTVTERYAHVAGTVVEAAARATLGVTPGAAAGARSHRDATTAARKPAKSSSHLRDLNSRPTVYESAADVSDLDAMGAPGGFVVAPRDGSATAEAQARAELAAEAVLAALPAALRGDREGTLRPLARAAGATEVQVRRAVG